MRKWAILKKATNSSNKNNLPKRKLSEVIEQLIEEGYTVDNQFSINTDNEEF